MKTFGLVLAMVVLASASYATVVTFDMYVGFETLACPVVPFNPEPSAVFNGLDFENGNPILQRYDPFIGYKTYDYWSQPDAYFGGILLGDGYQVYNDGYASGVNSVDGVPDGVPDALGNKTDMWISLPKAGWNLIGCPYNTAVTIDQDTGAPIYFTDGTQMLAWGAALGVFLNSDNMQRWSGPYWVFAGMNWSGEEQMLPGKGYWIYTTVDNLAMVILAP